MKPTLSLLLLITLCAASFPHDCAAGQTLLRSVGVRGGFSDKEDTRQYEAFAVVQLPWAARSTSGWGVSTQVGATAGVLSGNGSYTFIGSVGPAFSLGRTGIPLELDLGVSVAVLSRDRIGNRDVNGYAQFVSHAGVNYRFSDTLGLGYRFQHMSNAGLNGGRNPGINLHMFGLSWYFAE